MPKVNSGQKGFAVHLRQDMSGTSMSWRWLTFCDKISNEHKLEKLFAPKECLLNVRIGLSIRIRAPLPNRVNIYKDILLIRLYVVWDLSQPTMNSFVIEISQFLIANTHSQFLMQSVALVSTKMGTQLSI